MRTARVSKCHVPKSRKNSRGRCLRPGPISRNPYLNFLREFRKKCCGLSPVKTVQQGAKQWNCLSKEDKLRYIREAFYAPHRRRNMSKTMCRPVRRLKPARRSRMRPRKARRSIRRRNMCSM